jgi:uncharacterized protein involved in outer membrane biogenesis
MALLQNPIQRKLSTLLGADVSFERLNLSLLGGSIDARGVRVSTGGDDAEGPILTIARVRAELSMSRALRGEIVVRSIAVERPVLTLVRRPDGTTNLPRRFDADGEDGPAVVPDADGDARSQAGQRMSIQLDKLLVVDGELHFHQGAYHAAANGAMFEMARKAGGFDLTLILDALMRVDQPVQFGTAKAVGRLDGADDLSTLSEASIDLQVELGDLRGHVSSPSISSGTGKATMEGELDLSALPPMLPDGLLPTVFERITGRVKLNARAEYDRNEGLRVPSLELTAAGLVLPPTKAR